MVVFSAADIFIGTVSALVSVGAFKDEWTISDSKKSRILEILKPRIKEFKLA